MKLKNEALINWHLNSCKGQGILIKGKQKWLSSTF